MQPLRGFQLILYGAATREVEQRQRRLQTRRESCRDRLAQETSNSHMFDVMLKQ